MQPYTAAHITLLQDEPSPTFDIGCEVVDLGLTVTDDITADLAGGSVSRSSYATLHGTAQLQLARELDWGSVLVRPFMTIENETLSQRMNLGVYFTSVSEHVFGGDDPTEFDVSCFDVLSILDDAIGDAYAVDAGSSYLAVVEEILIARGVRAYLIDQASADEVLPIARTWMFDDRTTWLTVVNDLLAAVGYAGIYSDWDGRLRCHPYENPRVRTSEWLYTVDSVTSMLAPARVRERDFYATPNRWVFYLNNRADGATPIEGDGIYTYINQSTGDTSVEARGRVITRPPVGIDAANHAALVAAAQRTIDADTSVASKLRVSTYPNPLHWHFDVLSVDDSEAGGYFRALGTQWTLPLDGSDMSHEWSVLA